jgi:hypothetical protein
MTETVCGSKRWKLKLVRSCRISEYLHEMIKTECRRKNTDFSTFMRTAALGAMRNRTYQRSDTATEVISAKSKALPFDWW